mmetsp:Transcript_5544/g.11183  ORF Transcript_5544/g.11183 Transcript_5544/m.11183 type:complete len:84 (-) Transcript_5544:696-947(-)
MQRLIRGETATLPVKPSKFRRLGNAISDEFLVREIAHFSNQKRDLVERLGVESIFVGQNSPPPFTKKRTYHNRCVIFATPEVT